MICVQPVIIDGNTLLAVSSETGTCTFAALLPPADAQVLLNIFSIPPVADLSMAFWLGFNLVGVAALSGWAFGAVLNFIKT